MSTKFTPEHDLYNKIKGLPADDASFDSLPEQEIRAWYDMVRGYRKEANALDAIRFRVMDENDPVVDVEGIHWANMYFDWGWKGCGFGQLSFSKGEDGKLTCMNECMGRESVRKILIAMANTIADNVELQE